MKQGPGGAALEYVRGPSEGNDEQDWIGSPEAGAEAVASIQVRKGSDLAKPGAVTMGKIE